MAARVPRTLLLLAALLGLGLAVFAADVPAWVPRQPIPVTQGYRFLYQSPAAYGGHYLLLDFRGLWEYDPAADAWTTHSTRLPSMRFHYPVVVLGNTLYAIGGILEHPNDRYEHVAMVEAYDLTTKSWSRKADLLEPRTNSAAEVVNGKIYVFGGNSSPDSTGKPLPIVAYDPARNTWERKQAAFPARDCRGAHLIGGRVYVVCAADPGDTGDMNSNIEIYDPVADRMIGRVKVQGVRMAYATAELGGKVVLVGGHVHELKDAVSTVDLYDPDSGTWSRLPDLPKAKSWAGAFGYQGRLYVLGGVLEEWGRTERAVDRLEMKR
jgi:large repetitive protein